jgi:hypothetical protein
MEARRRLGQASPGGAGGDGVRFADGSSEGSVASAAHSDELRARAAAQLSPFGAASAAAAAARGARSGAAAEARARAWRQGFAYDARVAMLLVPCALLLFAVHGEVLVGIAGCGAILAYVADAAGLWLVGLVLTWCTVAAVVVALWILGLSSMGTSLFSVFLLNNFSFVTVQLGLWATLHVPQLRLDFAELLEQAEQLLFSTLCMPATALFCWAIASVAGTANVPFYAAFVMTLPSR